MKIPPARVEAKPQILLRLDRWHQHAVVVRAWLPGKTGSNLIDPEIYPQRKLRGLKKRGVKKSTKPTFFQDSTPILIRD
jgi:hypothetical protein